MAIYLGEIDRSRPDATFDLEGVVFKMTILETYTTWLAEQGIFEALPKEIIQAREAWKQDDTEENFTRHLGMLVQFFIEQVPEKSVEELKVTARIVARQQALRRWNVTTAIINHLRPTHNIIAVSLLPDWLMELFTEDLDFAALVGSTYVHKEGLFTDEAHSIDKAEAYAQLRDGDTTMLDIHMGDTKGDASILRLAKRPVIFRPSWTLHKLFADTPATTLLCQNDMLTVLYSDADGRKTYDTHGAPYDVAAILQQVAYVHK